MQPEILDVVKVTRYIDRPNPSELDVGDKGTVVEIVEVMYNKRVYLVEFKDGEIVALKEDEIEVV